MNRSVLLACGILAAAVCACGGAKPEKKEPEQLDPYRSPVADQINAVIYSRRSPEKILEKLDELGVRKGRLFGEFQATTRIDDWFGETSADGRQRYTSFTCGLSPVVDDAGRMVSFYRNRKFFEGKMYEEIPLSEDLR